MRGLTDGDILVYELADLKGEDGETIPLSWSMNALHSRLEMIKERSWSDELKLYLTGGGNFRKEIATIVPYKGTRKKEKPKWYKEIRWEMENNLGAIVVEGMEADDAMAIEQYKDGINNIICSRDKDLNMVPGWHYGWEAGLAKEVKPWFQDEIGGLRCFYKQMLTGDSVDNILGLYNVGKKSALLTHLDKVDTELEMFTQVLKHYTDRFGSYAYQFLVENGTLLYMLKEEGERWQDQADILLTKHDNLDSQVD